MGQGVGKTAWPKPAGVYQAITGRRYGGRHACVGFRPFLNSQDRDVQQQNKDCKQLELKDGQKENSSSFSGSSSPLVQVSAGLLDEPLSKDAVTREPICQSVSSQISEGNTSPLSVFSYGLEGNQISQDFMNPCENSEDLAESTSEGHNDLSGKNAIAFVNIESCEPDSSDGEEEDAQDKYSWVREAGDLIQGRLDNTLSQCEKEVESPGDVQSQLSAFKHSTDRGSCEEEGPMPFACPNNSTFKTAEAQDTPKSNLSGASYETQEIKPTMDAGIGTPVPIADVVNVSDGETENSSDLVVKPKMRKEDTAKQLERENQHPSDDKEEVDSWRKIGMVDIQQCHPECPLRDGKEMSSGAFFLSRVNSHQMNTETNLRSETAAEEQNHVVNDSTFWNESEYCNRHYIISHKDEESCSSECSDGEWSVAVPVYVTAVEKEQYSSDESWETIPEREDHDSEVQSSSSDVKEENTDFCSQEGEQALLEEGEVPWLQYREEAESSSDEENDPFSDFVHLGFVLLDGNNNLEDDSSVSEDLDVEWRLLDEFGDGLGLAQATPSTEPQLLAFLALEGRLEAVETALAQLESLMFDDEQTHPPATKETIESLPQIAVTSDFNGQEQCCTICCSEYVEGETITELPCHHLFHKPCVTLWLQRSRTCPVCRHVLAPVLPEAADDTFL